MKGITLVAVPDTSERGLLGTSMDANVWGVVRGVGTGYWVGSVGGSGDKSLEYKENTPPVLAAVGTSAKQWSGGF